MILSSKMFSNMLCFFFLIGCCVSDRQRYGDKIGILYWKHFKGACVDHRHWKTIYFCSSVKYWKDVSKYYVFKYNVLQTHNRHHIVFTLHYLYSLVFQPNGWMHMCAWVCEVGVCVKASVFIENGICYSLLRILYRS